ncbi:DUF1919 domain-containing protein [Bacillus sp. JJ1562]|uniref:DUF1919 domain-containing protein n=1 Tax=Bacillus sp. JJ1562 TaxID=3122960 RepID=UPI003002E1C6
MRKQIKDFIKGQRIKFAYSSDRKRLKNKNFTIISNNCWGGIVYENLEIEYYTPFVGLFLYLDDYIKLLRNLEYYMSKKIVFTDISKHEKANEERKEKPYPIGLLDDVEIHFLHYKDEQEASAKWERRKRRMNWDNLFIKISEADDCTFDILQEFDRLTFPNKVSFTREDYPDLSNNVTFGNYKVSTEMNHYNKYFDAVTWLNNGQIVKSG